MTAKPLPGFRDFPPSDFALRAYIFAAWRRVATRYGFEEYDGPPLETLELYTAKSGDEIVGQLYNFVDKGGRPVALRPEMTPTLARMVAERANGLKKPIRWFSIPQLFRYERQQRGRLREHFQLNCDLIGEPGPAADAEIVALAIDVMREFGLGSTDVRVRLSDRRALTALLRARGVTDDGMYAAYQFIDKLERMSPEDVEKRRNEPQAFAPATADDLIAIAQLRGLAQVEAAVTGLSGGDEAVAPLRATVHALEAMGLGDWVEIDFTIVRGLAYYTGTVFELFDAGRSLRAICGGGRYDTLLASLGGVDLPALGFGMGDVVLGELLKDRGLRPPAPAAIDLFVAAVTPDDHPEVLALAHLLRDAGLRVEYALGDAAITRQLKLADARGARLAVVVGPDDRARGEVQLKDLVTKSQEAVTREALPARCRDLLLRMS
jgi:histidyl-tRNA synthetase